MEKLIRGPDDETLVSKRSPLKTIHGFINKYCVHMKICINRLYFPCWCTGPEYFMNVKTHALTPEWVTNAG
jgi:hypothetical protein